MALMSMLLGSKKQGFCLPGAVGGTDTISLEMDVIISEAPEYTATPTKNQIEDGSDVTDHVALDPVKLSFQAVVSDTPVGWDKVFSGQIFQKRAEAAHAALLKIRNDRLPFDFVGSLGVYRSMVLTKYSPVSDAKSGKALSFTATIDQITIVKSRTIVAPGAATTLDSSVKHSASPTANAGHQATAAASEKSKSLLATLNDKFTFLPGLAR
jgi:hypothetical protein